jgi:hypothetical protein
MSVWSFLPELPARGSGAGERSIEERRAGPTAGSQKAEEEAEESQGVVVRSGRSQGAIYKLQAPNPKSNVLRTGNKKKE